MAMDFSAFTQSQSEPSTSAQDIGIDSAGALEALGNLSGQRPVVSTQPPPREETYNILGKAMTRSQLEAFDSGKHFINVMDANKVGVRGFGESITDVARKDMIPFIGDVLGVGDLLKIKDTFKRLNNNEDITDEERIKAAAYWADLERSSKEDTSGMVGDVLRQMPGFALEIGVWTGLGAAGGGGIGAVPGFFGGLLSAGGKLVGKAAVSVGTRALARSAAEKAIAKGVSESAEQVLEEVAGKSFARMYFSKIGTKAGAMLQTGAAMELGDLAVNAGVNILQGENLFESNESARERLFRVANREDEQENLSRLMGIGRSYVEFASEAAGPMLRAVASPVTGRLLKAAGRLEGENMGQFIDRMFPVGKALPIDPERAAEIARLKKVAGLGKVLSWISEAKDISLGQAYDFMENRLMYHGPLEEIGEERVGDFMKGLFGLSDDDNKGEWGLRNALAETLPEWKQLKAEAIAFSVPLVGVNMARRGQVWLRGGYTETSKNIDILRKATRNQGAVEEAIVENGSVLRDPGDTRGVTKEQGLDAAQFLADNEEATRPLGLAGNIISRVLTTIESIASGAFSLHPNTHFADTVVGGTTPYVALFNLTRTAALEDMGKTMQDATPEELERATSAARKEVGAWIENARGTLVLDQDAMQMARQNFAKRTGVSPDSITDEQVLGELNNMVKAGSLKKYATPHANIYVFDTDQTLEPATDVQRLTQDFLREKNIRVMARRDATGIDTDDVKAETLARIGKMFRAGELNWDVARLRGIVANPYTSDGIMLAKKLGITLSTTSRDIKKGEPAGNGWAALRQRASEIAAQLENSDLRLYTDEKDPEIMYTVAPAGNGRVIVRPLNMKSYLAGEQQGLLGGLITRADGTQVAEASLPESEIRTRMAQPGYRVQRVTKMSLSHMFMLYNKDPRELAKSVGYGYKEPGEESGMSEDARKAHAERFLQRIGGGKLSDGRWYVNAAALNDRDRVAVSLSMSTETALMEDMVENTVKRAKGTTLGKDLKAAGDTLRRAIVTLFQDRAKNGEDNAKTLLSLATDYGSEEILSKMVSQIALGGAVSGQLVVGGPAFAALRSELMAIPELKPYLFQIARALGAVKYTDTATGNSVDLGRVTPFFSTTLGQVDPSKTDVYRKELVDLWRDASPSMTIESKKPSEQKTDAASQADMLEQLANYREQLVEMYTLVPPEKRTDEFNDIAGRILAVMGDVATTLGKPVTTLEDILAEVELRQKKSTPVAETLFDKAGSEEWRDLEPGEKRDKALKDRADNARAFAAQLKPGDVVITPWGDRKVLVGISGASVIWRNEGEPADKEYTSATSDLYTEFIPDRETRQRSTVERDGKQFKGDTASSTVAVTPAAKKESVGKIAPDITTVGGGNHIPITKQTGMDSAFGDDSPPTAALYRNDAAMAVMMQWALYRSRLARAKQNDEELKEGEHVLTTAEFAAILGAVKNPDGTTNPAWEDKQAILDALESFELAGFTRRTYELALDKLRVRLSAPPPPEQRPLPGQQGTEPAESEMERAAREASDNQLRAYLEMLGQAIEDSIVDDRKTKDDGARDAEGQEGFWDNEWDAGTDEESRGIANKSGLSSDARVRLALKSDEMNLLMAMSSPLIGDIPTARASIIKLLGGLPTEVFATQESVKAWAETVPKDGDAPEYAVVREVVGYINAAMPSLLRKIHYKTRALSEAALPMYTVRTDNKATFDDNGQPIEQEKQKVVSTLSDKRVDALQPKGEERKLVDAIASGLLELDIGTFEQKVMPLLKALPDTSSRKRTYTSKEVDGFYETIRKIFAVAFPKADLSLITRAMANKDRLLYLSAKTDTGKPQSVAGGTVDVDPEQLENQALEEETPTMDGKVMWLARKLSFSFDVAAGMSQMKFGKPSLDYSEADSAGTKKKETRPAASYIVDLIRNKDAASRAETFGQLAVDLVSQSIVKDKATGQDIPSNRGPLGSLLRAAAQVEGWSQPRFTQLGGGQMPTYIHENNIVHAVDRLNEQAPGKTLYEKYRLERNSGVLEIDKVDGIETDRTKIPAESMTYRERVRLAREAWENAGKIHENNARRKKAVQAGVRDSSAKLGTYDDTLVFPVIVGEKDTLWQIRVPYAIAPVPENYHTSKPAEKKAMWDAAFRKMAEKIVPELLEGVDLTALSATEFVKRTGLIPAGGPTPMLGLEGGIERFQKIFVMKGKAWDGHLAATSEKTSNQMRVSTAKSKSDYSYKAHGLTTRVVIKGHMLLALYDKDSFQQKLREQALAQHGASFITDEGAIKIVDKAVKSKLVTMDMGNGVKVQGYIIDMDMSGFHEVSNLDSSSNGKVITNPIQVFTDILESVKGMEEYRDYITMLMQNDDILKTAVLMATQSLSEPGDFTQDPLAAYLRKHGVPEGFLTVVRKNRMAIAGALQKMIAPKAYGVMSIMVPSGGSYSAKTGTTTWIGGEANRDKALSDYEVSEFTGKVKSVRLRDNIHDPSARIEARITEDQVPRFQAAVTGLVNARRAWDKAMGKQAKALWQEQIDQFTAEIEALQLLDVRGRQLDTRKPFEDLFSSMPAGPAIDGNLSGYVFDTTDFTREEGNVLLIPGSYGLATRTPGGSYGAHTRVRISDYVTYDESRKRAGAEGMIMMHPATADRYGLDYDGDKTTVHIYNTENGVTQYDYVPAKSSDPVHVLEVLDSWRKAFANRALKAHLETMRELEMSVLKTAIRKHVYDRVPVKTRDGEWMPLGDILAQVNSGAVGKENATALFEADVYAALGDIIGASVQGRSTAVSSATNITTLLIGSDAVFSEVNGGHDPKTDKYFEPMALVGGGEDIRIKRNPATIKDKRELQLRDLAQNVINIVIDDPNDQRCAYLGLTKATLPIFFLAASGQNLETEEDSVNFMARWVRWVNSPLAQEYLKALADQPRLGSDRAGMVKHLRIKRLPLQDIERLMTVVDTARDLASRGAASREVRNLPATIGELRYSQRRLSRLLGGQPGVMRSGSYKRDSLELSNLVLARMDKALALEGDIAQEGGSRLNSIVELLERNDTRLGGEQLDKMYGDFARLATADAVMAELPDELLNGLLEEVSRRSDLSNLTMDQRLARVIGSALAQAEVRYRRMASKGLASGLTGVASNNPGDINAWINNLTIDKTGVARMNFQGSSVSESMLDRLADDWVGYIDYLVDTAAATGLRGISSDLATHENMQNLVLLASLLGHTHIGDLSSSNPVAFLPPEIAKRLSELGIKKATDPAWDPEQEFISASVVKFKSAIGVQEVRRPILNPAPQSQGTRRFVEMRRQSLEKLATAGPSSFNELLKLTMLPGKGWLEEKERAARMVAASPGIKMRTAGTALLVPVKLTKSALLYPADEKYAATVISHVRANTVTVWAHEVYDAETFVKWRALVNAKNAGIVHILMENRTASNKLAPNTTVLMAVGNSEAGPEYVSATVVRGAQHEFNYEKMEQMEMAPEPAVVQQGTTPQEPAKIPAGSVEITRRKLSQLAELYNKLGGRTTAVSRVLPAPTDAELRGAAEGMAQREYDRLSDTEKEKLPPREQFVAQRSSEILRKWKDDSAAGSLLSGKLEELLKGSPAGLPTDLASAKAAGYPEALYKLAEFLKTRGATVVSEQELGFVRDAQSATSADPTNSYRGRADVVVIYRDGSVDILDMKVTDAKKLVERDGSFEYADMEKYRKDNAQMMAYANAAASVGIKVRGIYTLPLLRTDKPLDPALPGGRVVTIPGAVNERDTAQYRDAVDYYNKYFESFTGAWDPSNVNPTAALEYSNLASTASYYQTMRNFFRPSRPLLPRNLREMTQWIAQGKHDFVIQQFNSKYAPIQFREYHAVLDKVAKRLEALRGNYAEQKRIIDNMPATYGIFKEMAGELRRRDAQAAGAALPENVQVNIPVPPIQGELNFGPTAALELAAKSKAAGNTERETEIKANWEPLYGQLVGATSLRDVVDAVKWATKHNLRDLDSTDVQSILRGGLRKFGDEEAAELADEMITSGYPKSLVAQNMPMQDYGRYPMQPSACLIYAHTAAGSMFIPGMATSNAAAGRELIKTAGWIQGLLGMDTEFVDALNHELGIFGDRGKIYNTYDREVPELVEGRATGKKIKVKAYKEATLTTWDGVKDLHMMRFWLDAIDRAMSHLSYKPGATDTEKEAAIRVAIRDARVFLNLPIGTSDAQLDRIATKQIGDRIRKIIAETRADMESNPSFYVNKYVGWQTRKGADSNPDKAELTPAEQQIMLLYTLAEKGVVSLHKVPNMRNGVPKGELIVSHTLSVPASWVEAAFQTSEARAKLLANGRDPARLKMENMVAIIRDQQDKVNRYLDRNVPGGLTADGRPLYHRNGSMYSYRTSGNGFMGVYADELHAQLNAAVRRETANAEFKLTMSLASAFDKDGLPKPLESSSEKMIQTLFQLKDLEFKSKAEAIMRIRNGDLADMGVPAEATFADVSEEIHATVLHKTMERLQRGEELNKPLVPDMASPLSIIKAMRDGKGIGFRHREHMTGSGKRSEYVSDTDAYEQAGILPDNRGAVEKLHRYVSEVAVFTQKMIMINQVSMMNDAYGAPIYIPDPNLSYKGKGIILDSTWRIVAENLARATKQKVDYSTSSKENVKRMLEANYQGKNQQYKYVVSPFASVGGFYVRVSDRREVAPADLLIGGYHGGEAANRLKQVLDAPADLPWGILDSLEHINAWSKLASLQLSVFFPIAAVESVVAAGGIPAMLELTGLKKGMNGLDLFTLIKSRHPSISDIIRAMEEKSITLSAMENPFHLPVGLIEKDARKIINFANQNVGKAAGEAARMLMSVPRAQTHFVFNVIFNTSKVWMALNRINYERDRAERLGIPPPTIDQVMDKWARVIDYSMGGPNPWRTSWYTPTIRRLTSLLMFSFPWTKAAWGIGGGGMLTGQFFNTALLPHEERFIFLRNWPNMFFWVLFVAPAMLQMASYTLAAIGAGGDDDDELRKKARELDTPWMWNNESGKKLQADITPLLRLSPFYKGEPTGVRRAYAHGGKQAYEVVSGWLDDPFKTFTGKLSNVARTVVEEVTQETIGMGWDLGFKDQGLAGWVIDKDGEFGGSRLGHIGKSLFVPFSISGVMQNPGIFPLQFFLPVSRGISFGAAGTAYYNLLKVWAHKDTYGQFYNRPDIQARLTDVGPEILEAAERNGYDAKKVMESARAAVLKEIYAGIFKAMNDNDVPRLEELSRAAYRVNGTLALTIKSMKARGKLNGMGNPTPEQRDMLREAFQNP